MNDSEFRSRAISGFHNLEYVFMEDLEQGREVERLPTGQQAAVKAVMFAASGVLGALGTRFAKFSDAEVLAALGKLASVCDLEALRFDQGGIVNLALFVYADSLPDEMLLGKSLTIQDGAKAFRGFNMKYAFQKPPVVADVFYCFEDSGKALHFRHSVQERCKHTSMLIPTAAQVLPWCVSISAKSVWPYTGFPYIAVRHLKPAQIEAALFC